MKKMISSLFVNSTMLGLALANTQELQVGMASLVNNTEITASYDNVETAVGVSLLIGGFYLLYWLKERT